MQKHHIQRGIMCVISSPSGAGKTTLTRMLLKKDSNTRMSISVTTRPMRQNEQEGEDYYFINKLEFDQMVAEDALLEHAEVFNQKYGTPAAKVEAMLAKGMDVIFDIDWQGKQSLAARCPGDVVSIFILPPSLEELERRLIGREQDSAEIVAARMEKAQQEISHWQEYDYVIINDNLEKSITDITAILKAERVKRIRQPYLADFVHEL